MRDANIEGTIWNLFTSVEFIEAAACECEAVMNWFGNLAVSRQAANFGRNNQIYDTFKQRSREFRQGAELAKLGDYKPVWVVSSSIGGDIRGIMEQPLRSWLTEAEYLEFSKMKVGKLITHAGQIERALNNAIIGADCFYNVNPNYPEGVNVDQGFYGKGDCSA